MKKQSFLHGSLILIASAVIAKAIGALFKIPLTNMLGGAGMGYFSCAYGLFLPVYALTATGLTTAVAKLTAESCAFGNYKNIRKIHRISLLTFSGVGLAGSVFIALAARLFAVHVTASPKAYLSVLMIAPSVLFGCITAVYRGCWEGMRNMYPTALSQVIEALVRLASGLAFCSYVMNNQDKVMPLLPAGTDPVAAAAAAAVLGISISTLAGTIFLFIRGTGLESNSPLLHEGSEQSSGRIIKNIFKILIPVALGSVVTNLTSIIDLATIIRCLDKAIIKNPQALADNLGITGIAPEEFSNFIYGSFTGLAVTVFNLVPSITNMFGKGILPSVAEAWTVKDHKNVEKLSCDVIKATAFLAVPAGLGISAVAPHILSFLYPEKIMECSASTNSLLYLGFGVIFLSLSFPVFSMLQAIGRADLPVKLMLVGVAVKLAGNLLLIPLPEINVSGAAISTTLCYVVIFVTSIIAYSRAAGIKLRIIKLLFPSVLSGGLCAVIAMICYNMFKLRLENQLLLPLSICAGGLIYLAANKLIKNAGQSY